MFGSDGYHPRSAVLVTFETPSRCIGGSWAAGRLGLLLGHGEAQELGVRPEIVGKTEISGAALFGALSSYWRWMRGSQQASIV
jgi:hypothetical protein